MVDHIVSGINIYPIKSLGGIALEQAEVKKEGFEWDRRWMLVDREGNFLTQREDHRLALFTCRLESGSLIVNHAHDEIEILTHQLTEKVLKVKVWSSLLKAQEVDPKLNRWFSEKLDKECFLVRMTEISHRDKHFDQPPFKTSLSFADGYPYLLLGEGSMKELNSRLEESLPIDRFRANIVFTSNQAHVEDEWSDISLGSAKLKVIKPCARCVVTTIDQQSGNKGKEPLKTLAGYRKKNNKIYFGANTIMLESGIIRLGDMVTQC